MAQVITVNSQQLTENCTQGAIFTKIPITFIFLEFLENLVYSLHNFLRDYNSENKNILIS